MVSGSSVSETCSTLADDEIAAKRTSTEKFVGFTADEYVPSMEASLLDETSKSDFVWIAVLTEEVSLPENVGIGVTVSDLGEVSISVVLREDISALDNEISVPEYD